MAKQVQRFSKLPEEEDFKRVLDRLHRITARGGPQDQHFLLSEGKSSLIILETNERTYGKLALKGMKSPLSVHIKRTTGRLITCLSRSIIEPQEGICDSQYSGDSIEVADAGIQFKSPMLYIGFHALEMATFTVSIRFGRLKASKSTIRPSDELQYSPPVAISHASANKPVTNMDYIALNMRSSASVERLSRMEGQRALSEERRRAVKLRHLAQIKGKKEWAMLQLRRREIRAEKQAKDQAKAVEIAMKTRAERGLLLSITHSHCLLQLISRLNQHYSDQQAAKIQHQKVSLIQRIARQRLFLHRSPSQLSLCIARDHFCLFLSPLRENYVKTAKNHLITAIKRDYDHAKLANTFSFFFERVRKVQRAAKLAISVRNYRLKQLNSLWSAVLGTMLDSTSLKKAHKKGKKGKNTTSALLSIPLNRKQQAILQHYTAQKALFGKEFRTYIERRQRAVEAPMPEFIYLPNEAVMKRMIEKAAQFSL